MRQQSCTSRGTTALLSTRLTRLFFAVWGGFLLMGLLLVAMTMTQRVQAAAPLKPVGLNAKATGETHDPMSKISVPQEGADLEVVKSVSDATPNEGQVISYTITVTNFGPEDATIVRIADTLPAGVTFSRYTATRGTYTGNVWRVNRINSDENVTLTIVVTVNQNTTGQIITNTASISRCDQDDPNSDNNTAEAVITVTSPAADLAVSKSVNPANPEENELITYTITVTNLGPDDATGVQISDTLPVSVTYIPPYTASQGSYNIDSDQWILEDPLAPGASATLIITTRVMTGTAGQTITNTASISASDQDDPDPTDDTAEAVLSVTGPMADLAVNKRVNQVNPAEGEVITYTITLTNLGPEETSYVEISDTLPISVTFAGYTATQGIYTNNRWIIDDSISPGTSLTLTIAATVETGTAGQTITNIASVLTVDPPDPNPINNIGTAIVTVAVTEADLAVIKTVDNSMPNAGNTITYMINVTNNGPDDATGVQINDLWPTGVTYLPPYSASQGNYNHESGLWNVDNLAHAASATLTISARVDTCPNGRTITNTAVLSASNPSDQNSSNNTDNASMTVTSVITCYVYLPIIHKDEPTICSPYFDDFHNSSSGWEIGDYIEVKLDYTVKLGDPPNKAKYFIYKKVSGLRIVQAPMASINKYSIETEASWDNNLIGYEYALIFGQVGNQSSPAYLFEVNSVTQSYRLRYGSDSIGWTCINQPEPCWVTPNPPSIINPGSIPNHLKLECEGVTAHLYVNNQHLWDDSVLCYGRIGFAAYGNNTGQTKAVAFFDNFRISCPFGIGSPGNQSHNLSVFSTSIELAENE